MLDASTGQPLDPATAAEVRDCFEAIKRHLATNHSALGAIILSACDAGLRRAMR